MRHCTCTKLEVVSLRESGAPATGSPKAHAIRHNAVINKIFEI